METNNVELSNHDGDVESYGTSTSENTSCTRIAAEEAQRIAIQNESESKLVPKHKAHKKVKYGSKKNATYKAKSTCQPLSAANEIETVNKALHNHLIMENIISFLGPADVKSCRLVSSRWNALFNKQFRKFHICSIRNSNRKGMKRRTISRFQQDFPDPSDFQFANFLFEGKFNANELQDFLNDRKFIKELHLHQVNLRANLRDVKTYDVSNWTGLNLTTLDIHKDYNRGKTFFVIPSKWIARVENLFLVGATILLDGERIAPKKIKMVNTTVKFVRNGKTVQDDVFDVNKCVDAVNLKEIDIRECKSTRLNLTQCLKLEVLVLDKGELIGLHKKLVLKRVNFCRLFVPFSELPLSVQEYEFTISPLNVFNSKIHFLHSVDSLLKSDLDQYELPLHYQGPNFRRVTVRYSENIFGIIIPTPIDVSNFFPAIKIITAPFIGEFVGTEKIIQLDKLVVEDFPFFCMGHFEAAWDNFEETIKRFSPNVVVISENNHLPSGENHLHYYPRDPEGVLFCGSWTKKLNELIQRNPYRIFVMSRGSCLGPLNRIDKICNFCVGPISRLDGTNPDSNYILCQNGDVKSIDVSEFIGKWVNG